MRWLLISCCFFLTSAVYGAPTAKEKCLSNENMVWVEMESECIPKNPCETENSKYCSFYKPKNITKKELYIPLVKLYAKVKYGITDCKLTKVGDVHYACVSDTAYVVFISDMDIQDKEPTDADKEQKTSSATLNMTRPVKDELNDALKEVCKIIGGRPDDELKKSDKKNPNYGVSGGCTGVSDVKCEAIDSVNTYEGGIKICPLYDIKEILGVQKLTALQ